jgi:hypothetical protein
MIFKKKINKLFVILVMSFLIEEKTDLWKLPNDNQLFSNFWELAVWEHIQLKFFYWYPALVYNFLKK